MVKCARVGRHPHAPPAGEPHGLTAQRAAGSHPAARLSPLPPVKTQSGAAGGPGAVFVTWGRFLRPPLDFSDGRRLQSAPLKKWWDPVARINGKNYNGGAVVGRNRRSHYAGNAAPRRAESTEAGAGSTRRAATNTTHPHGPQTRPARRRAARADRIGRPGVDRASARQ